jgi:hypothetical protein
MMRFVLAAGALALLLLVSAYVGAQSLGEVARQEEERRKTIAAPGKVYTNQDLHRVPAPEPAVSSSPASSAPGGLAQGRESDSEATPEPARDQAYWRERIQSERDALSRAELFAEALQSRINGLTADFTARDDPAQRSAIAADRDKALAELDRVKKEIAQRTKAVADIQEEARRAGVPPGWLR